MIKGLNIEAGLAALVEIQSRNITNGGGRALQLAVSTFRPGGIGGSPKESIVRIDAGIDWDASYVLLTPAKPLTVLTPEQVAEISDSARKGSSWHAYQAQMKLRDRIAELELEIAALKSRK